MTAVVWWKEYRQQRWIWATMLGLTVLLVVSTAQAIGRGGFWQVFHQEDVRSTLRTMALCLALAYGVVCGALLLAGEKEDGTQVFLDRLSPKRGPVWQAKLTVGVLLTLALAMTFLALGLSLGFMGWHWLGQLPLFSLDALAWGLLGGAIYRKVLPAVLAGTFFLVVSWLLPLAFGSWLSFLVIKTALALVGGYFSWKIYATDDQARAAVLVPPKIQRVPTSLVMGWAMVRQGRWLLACCLAGCVVTGIFIEHALLILWPVATWLVSISCGLAAFAPEQSGGQIFWGNQRFPTGRLWMWKVLLWSLAAVAMAAIIYVEAFAIEAFRDANARQPRDVFLAPIVSPVLWLVFGVAYGYAFGALFGLLFRRPVIAAIMAVAVGGVFTVAWMPSVFGGGLELWQVLPVPLLLLLTTRFCMRPWMSGRLYNLRTLTALAVVGLIGSGWLTGNLWYRVAEIPDVGPPFDIAAYRASIPDGEKNEAGRLIKDAAGKMAEHLKYVAYRLGPPAPVFPEQVKQVDSKVPGDRLTFQDLVASVLENGWPKDDAQLVRYLDLAFEGEWVKRVRRAVELPLGVVVDPRKANYSSLIPEAQECREMSSLFVARSRQVQAQGDHPGALDQLRTTLALSRQIENKSVPICFLIGRAVEVTALGAWPSWLEAAGPELKVIRSALQVLEKHEAARPAWSEALKGDYFVFQNTLEYLSTFDRDSRPNFETATLRILRLVPWESAREKRIFNAVFQAQLQALAAPVWQDIDSFGLQPKDGPGAELTHEHWNRIVRQSPLLRAWISTDHLRRAKATSERGIRATLLLTALALFQAENSRPAAKLDDLAPKYLNAIPIDPVTGESFHYRVSQGEEIEGFSLPSARDLAKKKLAKGQGVLWSEARDMPSHAHLTPEQRICFYAVPVWQRK